MKGRFTLVLLSIMAALFLSSCYFNNEVGPAEVGVETIAGKIIDCKGPGRWSNWGFWADLTQVQTGAMTLEISDPQVATEDNQLVGATITVQARRQPDCDSVKALLSEWPNLVNDDQFLVNVDAVTREAIKIGIRSMSLNELLDDRAGIAMAIEAALRDNMEKFQGEVVQITIENIGLEDEYAKTLQEKAQLKAQTEKELQRKDLIRQENENNKYEQEQREIVLKQKLLAEQAQTAVDVEIARRAGEIVKQSNLVYEQNESAFKLAQLDRLREIFGDKSVFYFVPEGTDLTMFFDKAQSVVPVPVEPDVPPIP